MKHLAFILLSFLFLITTKAKSQTADDDKQKCAARINFASPGSGIDTKTYDAVKKLIDDNKVKYTEKVYGREGETMICMTLKELKRKKKKKFVKQLKSTVKNGQFVSYSDN